MSDRFRFDDTFYPVPPAAVDADPVKAIRDLVGRVGRLEQTVEQQRAQARSELREVMLELVSLADDITNIVERWGVTTKAQDAAIAGSVLALGRRLLTILKCHRVEPVNTLGACLDPSTSDVVGSEPRENMEPNVVLREVQTGYTWPHGLLRRALVVVSARPVEGSRDDGPSERPASEDSGQLQ